MTSLTDRIAVVTGAARVSAKGIAIAFAREGADIVVADKVDEAGAAEVLAGMPAHGREACSSDGRRRRDERQPMAAMRRSRISAGSTFS